MESSKKEIIRKIESELLDKKYLEFEIINYSDDVSIPYLLKAWGDFYRDFIFDRNLTYADFVKRMQLHLLLQGIGHCIRWVKNSGNSVTKEPNQMNVLAGDLVLWGMEYNCVAQNFVAWSRGYLEVELNMEKKQISFGNISKEKAYFTFIQETATEKILDAKNTLLPSDKINDVFNIWARTIDIRIPPIKIDWKKAKASELSSILYKVFCQLIMPELDKETDIGNYTLHDFILFYTNVYINFSFITALEESIDREMGPENPFGSNPIDLKENEMVKFLEECTGVDKEKLKFILNDLTFDVNNFHSSLSNQPFVKSRDGIYFVLPRIFEAVDANRMLVGALNKSKDKKKVYDKLINTIEKNSLIKLKCLFQKIETNVEVLIEKRFSIKGEIITPDIIVIDFKRKDLLICDYKHFTVPISASETTYRLKDFEKGIYQVKKYIDFINRNLSTISINNNSIDNTFKIYGLMLLNEPMALPFEKPEDIFIVNIDALENLILKSENLEDLCYLINDNIAKLPPISSFFFDKVETKVDDWTFVRDILVLSQDK